MDTKLLAVTNFLGKSQPEPGEIGNVYFISFTLPTWPLSKRTLIPWGWTGDLVRISLTIPSVNFPDLWSIFNTIETRKPGLMLTSSVPLMLLMPPLLPSYHAGKVEPFRGSGHMLKADAPASRH